MVIGGRGTDNYPTNEVEMFAPGDSSCQAILPSLPDALFQPFCAMITTVGVLPATILCCGTFYPNTACYTFETNGAGWTKHLNVSNYYHSYCPAFLWSNRVYIIDDLHPESLDLTVSPFAWSLDVAVNVPKLSGNFTNGGGCAVVLNGVLYVFGGKATTLIKTIQLTSATWAWNYVGKLPTNTAVLGCAPIPNNRGVVMIAIEQSSSSTQTVFFDTNTNTLTVTASNTDLYGADILEPCHDQSLYAVVLGQSVVKYPATNVAGTNSNWQAVTNGAVLQYFRYFATSLSIPRSALGSNYIPAGCFGC